MSATTCSLKSIQLSLSIHVGLFQNPLGYQNLQMLSSLHRITQYLHITYAHLSYTLCYLQIAYNNTMPTHHHIQVNSTQCSAGSKFKFCFWQLCGSFFPQRFQPKVGQIHGCGTQECGGPNCIPRCYTIFRKKLVPFKKVFVISLLTLFK